MAKVLAIIKVLPEGVEVDLEGLAKKVEEKLPEGYQLRGKDILPIAFGLNALRLYITLPEETEGGTEKLEELVKSIEGVSQVEVEAVTRLSE